MALQFMEHPDFARAVYKGRMDTVYRALRYTNQMNQNALIKLRDFVGAQTVEADDHHFFSAAYDMISKKITENQARSQAAEKFKVGNGVIVIENLCDWSFDFDLGPRYGTRGFVTKVIEDAENKISYATVRFPNSEEAGWSSEYDIPNYALRKLLIFERIGFACSRFFWNMDRF